MTTPTITIEVRKGMIWNIYTNTHDINIQILDHDNEENIFNCVAPDKVMNDEEIKEYINKGGSKY